jgi:hypothetical protein
MKAAIERRGRSRQMERRNRFALIDKRKIEKVFSE